MQIPQLEESVLLQLTPNDPLDEKGAIVEVRAGTGGEEASLFAEELFNMYARFAQAQNWQFEPIEVRFWASGSLRDPYLQSVTQLQGRGST